MATDFIYLYGFVPDDVSPPADLIGIAGTAVQLLPVDALKAVLSRVPADVYDPARIDERLQDLTWVSAQGVAHESVVAWFVDHAEILPVSLFTLYSSEAALLAAVSPRAGELTAELARLRNKREWDLKVSFVEKDVEQHAGELSPSIGELDRQIAQATPGKRFLLEKKRADLLKAETRHAAHALADQALQAARAHAVEVRRLPIPRTAEELPVVLHAALLVERSAEADLGAALEQAGRRLERLGVNVRFSGPWAPYRFTGNDERAAPGRE
ncbi:MAG: GvpL/GvpF family gas vesicle protein [Gemmatimonadota bacterium]